MIHYSHEKFKELMKIPENKKCFDCDNISCQWASVNNGIFLCTNCSGIHRGLGVEKSYIKSIVWDNWTENQMEFMKQGGNKQLKELLYNYNFDKNLISRENFYQTKIMDYYRKYLKCKVEKKDFMEEPPSNEEAFKLNSINLNINNENKFTSIGSDNPSDSEKNNNSFQDNITNWLGNTYEGAKDTFNKLELGNKISYVKNSVIDTGNTIFEKTQIKSFAKKAGENISYYYNWFLGNNSENKNNINNNNMDKQSQNINSEIINDKNNNNNDTITNNDSKENIKNDINVNY